MGQSIRRALPAKERLGLRGTSDLTIDDEPMTVAAAAVLQHLLSGKSLAAAASLVAVSHSISKTDVSRCWARKKRAALTMLTIGRMVDAAPWTAAEVQRLCQVFYGERWFVPPTTRFGKTSPAAI